MRKPSVVCCYDGDTLRRAFGANNISRCCSAPDTAACRLRFDAPAVHSIRRHGEGFTPITNGHPTTG